MHKILVVEDDTTINQVICEFLKENHYEVTPVLTGQKPYVNLRKNRLTSSFWTLCCPL